MICIGDVMMGTMYKVLDIVLYGYGLDDLRGILEREANAMRCCLGNLSHHDLVM